MTKKRASDLTRFLAEELIGYKKSSPPLKLAGRQISDSAFRRFSVEEHCEKWEDVQI